MFLDFRNGVIFGFEAGFEASNDLLTSRRCRVRHTGVMGTAVRKLTGNVPDK